MTKYNWNERHIITFPEEKLALATKDLHVYYGQKEAIKGIDMQFEKIKSLLLSDLQDVVNQLFFVV
jgi:3a0107s01c2: phosphate ABC transporter, ATP-binding protein